jgi:hypothetical protein
MKKHKVSIYRKDSVTPIIYEPVKHTWFIASNTVLVISIYSNIETGEHYYIHWPIENIEWFKVEKI